MMGRGIKIQLVKLNVNSCPWVIVSSEHHTSMESVNLTSIITLQFLFLYSASSFLSPQSCQSYGNIQHTHRTLDFTSSFDTEKTHLLQLVKRMVPKHSSFTFV